eukprot:CAMPEP_0174722152 /NCGR_PEP_ID=MMETSP1094-20130205/37685_1 /TAXON_ID=156173 /ORGANISM="Chrysochromulina brevifilum, Strain UTEX LB 985" /LENGTH=899 /DNA_ID=CAMNT_0015922949 /DNA_START=13 /DNA_END=2712 /DNA_ORIENTATION=-
MGFRLPWTKPPPPPPPPPPPSLHLWLKMPADTFILAAQVCIALALLILIGIWLMKRKGEKTTPRVTVQVQQSRQGRIVAMRCLPGTALCEHVKRLLLQRGFSEVRCASTAEAAAEACRGASVAIDLAYEQGSLAAGHEAFLNGCAKHGVSSVVLCSDALVGYDPNEDVTDGDERWDAGPSLERTTPREPVKHTGRLLQLQKAEEMLADFHGEGKGALVVRLHRVYSSGATLASFLPVLLASGLGLICGGARALTNLTHVEDAALGIVLATDKLLDGFRDIETITLTDPAVWSVAHLLHSLAIICRLPPPLLPLLAPIRMLSSMCTCLGMPSPASLGFGYSHCYFTGVKAKEFLGFAPKAGTLGLHAALLSARSSCGMSLRLVPTLLTLSSALLADAYDQASSAAVLAFFSFLLFSYACLPPPKGMPAQGEIYPAVVSGGLPLIGHLPAFMKGPVSMFDGLRARYRSVFTIKVGPQRITMLVGAEASFAFNKSKDDLLLQAPVYSFTIPVFGKGIIYDSPIDEYQQQVKLLVHNMNTKSLDNMIPKMIREAESYFGNWGNEGTVELRKVFSELIILTASSCLMGREIREGLSNDIARIYHSLDGGLTPLSTLWPSAPTAAHRERDRARKEMEGIFAPIIASRRSGAVVEDDFLQEIIKFRYKDTTDPMTGRVLKRGRGFSDSEIVGLLVVLLFAGQHTSSITSTWLGARILTSPEALAELRAEQERMVPDKQSLNYSNLLEMNTMRRSITEALRLYPPLVLLMRKVMKSGFKVGQLSIPKGDVVGVCAPATNLDPRYWHDATDFKPGRFAPDGQEADTFDPRTVGHGVKQGLMMAFGGGGHMCSGRRFGFLQVSTIWTILLRDFELEMTSPLPKPAYNDMVVGPDGPINVKFKRKVAKAV